MRRISFSLTERQLLDRTKTVTRRLAWKTLKAGDELLAVDRCMGLKKGQKSRALARIRVLSVCREPLFYVTNEDAAREGFPELTGAEFVEFFCKAMKCTPAQAVNRIEFELVEVF